MRHITINKIDYPFNLPYSVFKYGLSIAPDGKTELEVALKSAEMIEKLSAKSISHGYKMEGSDKEMSHEQLLELLDTDHTAFINLRNMVEEGMKQFTPSETESTEGIDGKK